MLVSIIIPTVFNQPAVDRVLGLIRETVSLEHEIIVKDSTPTPIGCVKPTNEGLAEAKGDFLVMMNDDCQPQPGWLDHILHHIRTHDLWLASPTWQYARFGGHCLVMPRKAYEATGGLDERYRHWCSDHHLELQIHELGGLMCQVPRSEVVHDPGDLLRIHFRKSRLAEGHEQLPNTGQWYLEDQAIFESIWGKRKPQDIWPADWTTPA